jgi:hypothetical protein
MGTDGLEEIRRPPIMEKKQPLPPHPTAARCETDPALRPPA